MRALERAGKTQSEPSGLKKNIEKTSKSFEKPLDKRKRVCYTNEVARESNGNSEVS